LPEARPLARSIGAEDQRVDRSVRARGAVYSALAMSPSGIVTKIKSATMIIK
jgi:hypothetical protein